MFAGRHLLIATKHKKEIVLGPLFEKNFGLKSFVATDFDTDILGTFTGEVERKQEPVQTVRMKCLKAMELYGCDLGIASEGSFGAHPFIPFLPANEEFLIFIDSKNNLEIIARELGLETNFSAEEITTWEELVEFAGRAEFPSHGLILRNTLKNHTPLFKGITNWKHLKTSFDMLRKNNFKILVETDMRAMYNPTRMKVIEKAAQKLVEKIKSCCPHCNYPGFSIIEAKPGLSCNLCGSPTRSTLSYLYECQKCSFKKEEEYPHGKYSEDPAYCDFCNP